MILVTTPLKEYLNFSKKIIFLGKWCLLNISSNKLKDINYEILPYHWSELDKVEKDSYYIYNIYKKTIPILSSYLNTIHNKKYSNRYWEVLVGPWLYYFTDYLFEKYSMIKYACEKYDGLETHVNDNIFVPYSMADFSSLIGDDEFNFYIFNRIIKLLDLPIQPIKANNLKKIIILNSHKKKKIKRLRLIKNLIRKFIVNFFSFFFNFFVSKYALHNNEFWDLNMPIKTDEKKDFFKEINQVYYEEYRDIYSNIPTSENLKINFEDRNYRLNIANTQKDKFLDLVTLLVPSLIPMEYFEHYSELKKYFDKFLPKKNLKLVCVRSALEYNSVIRYLTSGLSERNTKIISFQEGGGMGVRKFNQIDEKVNFIGCDKFLTWGWESKQKNTYKFFFTKTFFIKDYEYNKNGRILLTGGSCRKYHESILFGHLPFYNDKHIEFNIELINNLKNQASNALIYRFHNQLGYNEPKKVLEFFPNLTISLREKTTYYYELLFNSRLVICTSDYTANLQPLIINHPTIWLWDPNYFKVRDSMKKYYDIMAEASILHYSPISCANHINKIYENPMDWWMTPKVQNAKNIFSENCCRYSDNISSELALLINKFLKEK